MAPPHYSDSRSRGYGPSRGGYHHHGGSNNGPSNADPRSDRRTGPGGREEGRGYHKSRDMYYQQQPTTATATGGRGNGGGGAAPNLHQQQQQHHHHRQHFGEGGRPGGNPYHHHHHHHHGGGHHHQHHHRKGVERYADGRRKVANYDFEASILNKIGSCNMPVYFSFETITSTQLKDPSLFKTALPPGIWMTPELPIRATKLTCTLKELIRYIGTYLLGTDDGSNPDRAQVQRTVAQRIPEGTPITVFFYKQLADEKDLRRPIEGVSVDCLVEGQPLTMMTVQSLEDAIKELKNDSEQPNDPFHRPVFESRSSREHTYNGNGIFIVCPTARRQA